jgi:hypothetical protein
MVSELLKTKAAGSSTEVYDGLDSTNTAAALSANQGRILNEKIPVKLSQLENDTDFISATVENLTNFYNKNEVQGLVNAISTFSAVVVTQLPAANISTTAIYLIVKTDNNDNDYYDEYMYINNKWEMIGTTKIDLSNYYTKSEIDAKKLPNPNKLTFYYYNEYTGEGDNNFPIEYDGSEQKFLDIRVPPGDLKLRAYSNDVSYDETTDTIYIAVDVISGKGNVGYLTFPISNNLSTNIKDTTKVLLRDINYPDNAYAIDDNYELLFNEFIAKYCVSSARQSNRGIQYYCPMIKNMDSGDGFAGKSRIPLLIKPSMPSVPEFTLDGTTLTITI